MTNSFASLPRPNRSRFNPMRFTLCASELLRHANRFHGNPFGDAASEIYAFGGDSDIVRLAYFHSDKRRQEILAKHGFNEDTFEAAFRSRVRYNYRMHNLLSLMLEG